MAAPVYIDHKGSFTLEELTSSPSARLLVAASIAMYVVKRSKVHTWAELGRGLGEMDPAVMLEPWQVELLAQNDAVLQVISVKLLSDPKDRLSVTVAACTTCHRWMAVSSGTGVPSKCNLTLNCTGSFTKATAAGPRPAARLLPDSAADAAA